MGRLGYYSERDVAEYATGARSYNPAVARFVSADPLGIVVAGNLYTYVLNAPTRSVDPSGLAGIVDFNQEDVGYCYKLLSKIAKAGTYLGLGYPCASALLFGFLYSKKGVRPDPCPTACMGALTAFFNATPNAFDGAMLSSARLFATCASRTTLSAHTKGSYAFAAGDLYYGLHAVNYALDYDCAVTCGPLVACCCSCGGLCGYSVRITDTYDFCSSLKPTDPKRGLVWCGCLLEQEGIGKTYAISCNLPGRTRTLPGFTSCLVPTGALSSVC